MNTKKKNEMKELLKMNRCRYCKTTHNLTIDHKIPKIQGGTDATKNLQCLCRRCNQIKSGLSHRQVMIYFKWFLEIQKGRQEHGKKIYGN